MTVLAFLPPEYVQRHFNRMKTLVMNDEQLSGVCRYFDETWIGGFGVEIISQYDEAFRTNNCAESFHNSLRTTFPSPNTNFYDFDEILAEIWTARDTSLTSNVSTRSE